MICSLVALATPAFACQDAASKAITLSSWKVSVAKDEYGITEANLTLVLRNNGEKATRLVDAKVEFADALGGYIPTIGVNRDLHLKPGAEFTQKGSYPGTNLNRIPSMAKEDVMATVCTTAVTYEDGTKSTFN